MEATIEQKLKALYELQTIHSEIDKIRIVRGELPMEVADLEDDVAGLETRINKIKEEINELEDEIVNRKNTMKQAAASIKKYEEQQNNVKNNREYEALSKEIEIQGLDIQVSEKKIKEVLHHEDIAKQIAKLIYERQIQKYNSRLVNKTSAEEKDKDLLL